MKIAIAQSGPEDAGKTSTIRLTYNMLREKYPDAAVENLLDNKSGDLRAVLTINGILIGIESQGDPWKKEARLEPSLAMFVRLRCQVIICAIRTSGGTLEVFRSLEDDGYQVTVRNRTREVGSRRQEARNLTEANWMIEQIESQFAPAVV